MSIKQDRTAERIRIILSELLMREVSDPRLQNITITEVTVDAEIMFATIYVNALGDETRETEVLAGLKRANGFLRRELSKRLRVRTTPELRFHWDATLERANRVEALLNDLDIPEAQPEADDLDFDFDLFEDEDEDDFDDIDDHDPRQNPS